MNHEAHKEHKEYKKLLEDCSKEVIGCAIKVHQVLGPGLLENAYEACLCHELIKHGFRVERQKPIPLIYDGTTLDCGYRIDLLVNDYLVIEVKAVDTLSPLHDAQVLTYLRLSHARLGLLINFNVQLLKQGIKRLIL